MRLLRAAAFLSTFDRFAVAPMLVTIAADLGAPLSRVAAVASLCYLLYGLMQPVWGMLLDRLGRVRVMRIALLAVVVPGLLSAAAPDLAVLVAGRALAGALFSAVIPAALVYIGDAVPIPSRQKPWPTSSPRAPWRLPSPRSWRASRHTWGSGGSPSPPPS